MHLFSLKGAPTERLFFCVVISLILHLLLIFGSVLKLAGSGAAGFDQSNVTVSAVVPLQVSFSIVRPSVEEMTNEQLAEETGSAKADDSAVNSEPSRSEAIAGEMGGGRELVYYTTDKLTRPPEVLEIDDLNTPETRSYKVSGSLVMNLWIDDQGRVAQVSVFDSALPPIFAEVAVRIFKAARFKPGELNGLPVGTLMKIEVGYEDKAL